jgi:hypothetical protein
MAESALHKQLIRSLVGSIVAQHEDCFLFADGDHTHSQGCPPQLEAVRPDVYPRLRNRHVVIGEAKTPFDIDKPHTKVQLDAYFRHLACEPSGELLVAVPYLCVGLTHRLCRHIRRLAGAESVPFEVSGWMYGSTTIQRAWRG